MLWSDLRTQRPGYWLALPVICALSFGCEICIESDNPAPLDDDDTGDDDSGDDDVNDDDTGDDDDVFAARCWTLAPSGDGSLVVIEVDMDTGAASEIGRYGTDIHDHFETEGMARIGNTLIMSGAMGSDDYWLELDMETESITTEAVNYNRTLSASDGDIIRVDFPHAALFRYADFDALVANDPSSEVVAQIGNDLCAADETEIFAWRGDEVDKHDVWNGCWLETIQLEDWSSATNGMSLYGTVIYLVEGGSGRIAGFHRNTGRLVVDWTVVLDGYSDSASGLWCGDTR